MSEDKRKSARTQGRFSGGDREYSSKQPDKQNSKMSSADKNKGEKRKVPVIGSRAQNEMDLQYTEKSKHSFKELEPVRKPQELRFYTPVLELSVTDNGVSKLIYDPGFLRTAEADEYMTILDHSTAWHDKNIVIRGVEYPQPRLVAWYGPYPYTYAGATLEAREMPNVVCGIKEKIEAKLREHGINVELNSVLLNLYRNEKDSVAWHSDDELTLGVCPTIASISLGETRRFEMRPKENVTGLNTSDISYVNLTHGSLVVMDGCMQKDWQHRVPKEFHDKKKRINLTFRTIYPVDQLPPEMPNMSNLKSVKTPSAKVVHQEHKFDTENFPPLGLETNDKKAKFLPKGNGNKDCHQSTNQRKHQKEEKWNCEIIHDVEGIEGTQKIQNNLNKKPSPGPIVNLPDEHSRQTDINLNIKESAKSYNPKDFIRSECRSDNFETYQSHSNEPNHNPKFECENSIPSESKSVEIEAESAEIKAKAADSGKKYMLNADAPDFIPQKMFEKCSLSEFAKHCFNLKNEDVRSFTEALFECIHKNEFLFLNRDFYEFEVYERLKEDGSISIEHLKIILERISSMITNAIYKNGTRYRNPSNSFDDNNYYKHRQSYGRSPRY